MGRMEQENGEPIRLRAVPTRIEIELTSTAGDGSWTWRAAGAREPKGVLDGSILPRGAAVGDHLRADSEHDVEGIRILSIVPPKQKSERSDQLELLPVTEFEPVTQQRVGRDRGDGGRPRSGRRRDDGPDRRADRDGGGERRRRDSGDADRSGRRDRPTGDARSGPRRDPGDGPGERGRRAHRPHFTPPPELPQRPKPKRLRPGKQHLTEVLSSLPEEQRPVAELALQGLAAVRQRLREDNARSRAEHKPEMPEATVVKMAEELLPQIRVAEWRDRAEAAQRQLEHLDLRDLRSVVAASDDPVVVRDESTRELAAALRSALTHKQEEELALWLGDVEAALGVGRVVRALRLSAEPPKAGVPFPSALGAKLGAATNAALTSDDPSDRWITVLEAAAFSPIRAQIAPAAAPAQPAAELVATVTRLGPLLPQIAALFSVAVPERAPTPKPLRRAPKRREGERRDGERKVGERRDSERRDEEGKAPARRIPPPPSSTAAAVAPQDADAGPDTAGVDAQDSSPASRPPET